MGLASRYLRLNKSVVPIPSINLLEPGSYVVCKWPLEKLFSSFSGILQLIEWLISIFRAKNRKKWMHIKLSITAEGFDSWISRGMPNAVGH